MIRRPSIGNSSRAAALLLTIWCVAIVSLTVVLVARIVDHDVDDESVRTKRFEARQLALTGIAHGMNPSLPRDSEFFHQRTGHCRLEVRLTSESARLNINVLLREQGHATLKRLFSRWGIPDPEARIVIDSLADWVDEGDLRRLNGAERDQLLKSEYSLPQNRDFISVDEMRSVRGMDVVAKHRTEWAETFTIFGDGRIDLQDAKVDVLCAAGVSPSQAEAFVRYRNGPDGLPGTSDDRLIKSVEDLTALLGLDAEQTGALAAKFVVGSEPSRIESVATFADVSYRISSIIDRKSPKSIRLSWEES